MSLSVWLLLLCTPSMTPIKISFLLPIQINYRFCSILNSFTTGFWLCRLFPDRVSSVDYRVGRWRCQKKCQSGCGAQKKTPFAGASLVDFLFHKITLLLLLYFQVFFTVPFFRPSWSFYAQAPGKWTQKEVKKDTLNQEKPDWATLDFWHTLWWICLI